MLARRSTHTAHANYADLRVASTPLVTAKIHAAGATASQALGGYPKDELATKMVELCKGLEPGDRIPDASAPLPLVSLWSKVALYVSESRCCLLLL